MYNNNNLLRKKRYNEQQINIKKWDSGMFIVDIKEDLKIDENNINIDNKEIFQIDNNYLTFETLYEENESKTQIIRNIKILWKYTKK